MCPRNFLRPFQGVNEEYQKPYVMVFEWSDNIETATDN